MTHFTLQKWINVAAVLATLIINGLANAIPLNGQTTGEISDRFQVYFVPAGYVFSIWGLIYITLIAFAIYQVLPSQADNPHLHRIGYLFALSCLANISWLFLWHYEYFGWTLIAMGTLLATLIAIYLRLGIGQVAVSSMDKWFVHIPFSIYLGWVTVATIANVTSVLDYIHWGGWGIGEITWTIIMLIVATGITFAVILSRRDIAYALVIIWAFTGIGVKHADTPAVSIAAWVAAAVIAAVTIGSAWLTKQDVVVP